MSKPDVRQFFMAALKAELEKRGHGFQSELAKRAGVSRSTVNDILKGRSSGSDRNRRAMAEALGYTDYEDFLDIGRQLSGAKPVRAERNSLYQSSAEIPAVLELLVENRSLRIRLEEQSREMESLKTRLARLETCDPSVRETSTARAVKNTVA